VNPDEKHLIRYRLERARETLEQAQVMSDTGHPAGAINRLYYACFYAVNALLLCRNMASAKHSGVLSLFNRHFIKTGVFSADMGKFYSDLFDSRQDADYADMVEVEDAQLNTTTLYATPITRN
jgi:uncharacterized protein (UPF0332 family)